MKCVKCKTDNIINANYCKNCGYEFSKKEKKKAKRWTLAWFLEIIDKIKSIFDLSIITGNILFKVLSVIVILIVGIYYSITSGTNLKILNSDNYQIQYNTKLDEYYLIANKEETTLNLYVPNRTKNIIIKHLDGKDLIIEEKEYCKECEVLLNSNGSEDYYIIETKYENNNLDRMKLYVYYEEVSNDG